VVTFRTRLCGDLQDQAVFGAACPNAEQQLHEHNTTCSTEMHPPQLARLHNTPLILIGIVLHLQQYVMSATVTIPCFWRPSAQTHSRCTTLPQVPNLLAIHTKSNRHLA
jgi:hypothetical protein